MTTAKKKSFLEILSNTHLLSMFFMGLACGFPFALTASTLKTWLSEYNISMKEIGAFAFIAIPYSIKFLWSPFIDGIKIGFLERKLGHRRSWLIVIQSLLIFAIFLLANSNPEHSILYCAAIATVVSFLSASQDIVVDAYRIESLDKNDQSIGVTMYIYGYRIGLYVAGAVLLVIADFINWKYAYYVGTAIMSLSLIVTILSKDEKTREIREKTMGYLEHFKKIVINPFENFVSTNGWQYILLFIVLFKLGDALAGNLTFPFLIKLGFSKTEIALIVKTYGLPATLFGAFLGGIIVHRLGLIKALVFAGVIQMLSNIMFIVQDQAGHNNIILTMTIMIENISGSIGDVIFIGYISSICSFRFAATQYALLSSIATVGRNLISGTSGFIVDDYGWTIYFLVSIIAAIPGILMMIKIKDVKRSQDS